MLIAVALELRPSGKLSRTRLCVMPDVSKDSLIGFIKDNVDVGSEVIPDGFSSCASLSEHGYKHTVYVQKKPKSEEEKLPHVHLIISLVKCWFLGTHQGAISDKHMQAYLDEYTFRFNRRKAAK